MTPLVPPASDATAAVGVEPFHVTGGVMLNDMRHPEPAGQLMGAVVTWLPATLKNIRSVVPFSNSAIGEQATLALVSVGPTTGVPMVVVVIGICHSALFEPLVLQTYKFPVPLEL
jgi:hypothetical protein